MLIRFNKNQSKKQREGETESGGVDWCGKAGQQLNFLV